MTFEKDDGSLHRIRLHGPWQAVHSLPGLPGEVGFRVKVPCLLSDIDPEFRHGTLRLTRSFNCPSGLTEHQSVWLRVGRIPFSARLSINGLPAVNIPRNQEEKVDIRDQLQSRNQIVLEVELGDAHPADETPVLNEVGLEIED